MEKYIKYAREIALAGSFLLMTARVACVSGILAASAMLCTIE